MTFNGIPSPIGGGARRYSHALDSPLRRRQRMLAAGAGLLLIMAVGFALYCAQSASLSAFSARSTRITRRMLDDRWPNGRLRIRRQVIKRPDGTRLNDGVVEVWYEDGRLRSVGHWIHGKKHGEFVFWYPNGQTARQMGYRLGLAHGSYREWDEQGQLVRQEIWQDGRPIEGGLQHES